MQIASLVDNLSASQSSFYMVKNFNKLVKDTQHDAGCFFANLSYAPVPTFFTVQNLYYLQYFHGVVIADSLEMANVALKTKNNSQKYLYLWDLEWIRSPTSYENIVEILHNPKLKIIARSESHANLITNFCNRVPCAIIDDWNIEQIKGMVSQ